MNILDFISIFIFIIVPYCIRQYLRCFFLFGRRAYFLQYEYRCGKCQLLYVTEYKIGFMALLNLDFIRIVSCDIFIWKLDCCRMYALIITIGKIANGAYWIFIFQKFLPESGVWKRVQHTLKFERECTPSAKSERQFRSRNIHEI